MTTNAPVGPPIWTFDPPNAEIRKPATMAVHNPRSGVTPLAIAKAIANGSATTPTTTPARASRVNCARSYAGIDVTSLGMRTERREVGNERRDGEREAASRGDRNGPVGRTAMPRLRKAKQPVSQDVRDDALGAPHVRAIRLTERREERALLHAYPIEIPQDRE